MPRQSFRWPGTHPTLPDVLKAHGFVESNGVGDVAQVEADNFALEPGKWRWGGTQWVAYTPPAPSDRLGFTEALKTIFPDDLLTLRRVLILFWLVEHEEWPRLEKAILAAKAAGEITSGSPTAQYEQIKAAVVAKRIPATLP